MLLRILNEKCSKDKQGGNKLDGLRKRLSVRRVIDLLQETRDRDAYKVMITYTSDRVAIFLTDASNTE